MRKSVAITLFFTAFFFNCFAQRELKNPLINSGTVIEKGVALHDEGKYKEAIREYLTVPESDTNYSKLLHELILSYYNDSNFVAAEKYVRYAMQRFPENNPDWLSLLADVYDDSKRSGEALNAYDTILKMKPYDYLTFFNKGVSLFRAERLEEAEKNFEQCLLINPYYTSAHYFLGKLQLLKGNLPQAMMSFSCNLLISPGNRYKGNAIQLMNSIAEMNSDIEKLAAKHKAGKEDDFEAVQDIISSKIALDKKYKLQAGLEDQIVRQLQVMMEKLEFNANDRGFWMQYYVPLFRNIWDHNKFEPFVFYIFSKVDIKKVTDYVNKEKKEIDKMSDEVVNYFNQLRETQELQYNARESAKTRFYIKDYSVNGKGQYGLNGKKEVTVTGDWEFYHTNGRLKSKGNFNNEGRREGEWHFYYDNGVLQEITFYQDGKAQGKSDSWHENGIIYKHSNYKDDELDGEMKAFYYNGLLRYIIHYKAGKKDGEARYYTSDGNLSSVSRYADDKAEGPEISYYDNGKIESKANYVNDEPAGAYEEFYDDGKPKLGGQFENGKKTGTWKSLYRGGQAEYVENYSKGELDGEYLYYYENGKLQIKSNYRKGEVDGKKEDYDDDGILFSETVMERGRLRDIRFFDKKGQVTSSTSSRKGNANITFYSADGRKTEDGYFNREGEQEGKAIYYYKNGKVSTEANYNKGLLEGKRTTYYSNGSISQEGFYKNNKPDGYFVNYYINGTVSEEGWYVEGDRQGTFLYYDQLGNLSTKRYFLNDNTDGVTEYFHPNGNKDYTEYYNNGWFERLTQYDSLAVECSSAATVKGEAKVIFKHFNGKTYIDCNYNNYKLNGIYKIINGDGSNKSISYYKNGERDSLYRSWFPNGKPETEGWYRNADKTGEWKYYWRNGQLSETEFYERGRLTGRDIQYNEDGSTDKEMNFKNGNMNGEYRLFADNKQLAAVLYYKNDEVTGYSYEDKNGALVPVIPVPGGSGAVTAYFKNGNKSLEATFSESLMTGDRVLYFSNGKTHVSGKRIFGLDDGNKKIYYASGKLMKEENYLNGALHGNCKYYGENGILVYDINYYNGDLHGSCKYYENGKLTENLVYYYGILEAKK